MLQKQFFIIFAFASRLKYLPNIRKKMKKENFYLLPAASLVAASLFFTSCKTEDTPPSNEQEEITTIRLLATNSATAATRVYTFKDLDGPAGNPPSQIDTIALAPNQAYSFSVVFADDTKSPAVDITPEIRNEANDHQVFYRVSGTSLNVAYSPTDRDGNNPPKPVGLTANATTGPGGAGTLRIVLKHQPDGLKGGIAASQGDITQGDTDVDITFPYVVR